MSRSEWAWTESCVLVRVAVRVAGGLGTAPSFTPRRWLIAAVLGGGVAATAYWRRALTVNGALAAAVGRSRHGGKTRAVENGLARPTPRRRPG